ncbi:hypothetical protein VKT23_020268 [Stygiomarasmius scandens]|uniref:Uncharacterized protein n=1 Tax=Marasmiellus scandens TaxID=2682957 RepID=A0ABR1IM27_9AGAR
MTLNSTEYPIEEDCNKRIEDNGERYPSSDEEGQGYYKDDSSPPPRGVNMRVSEELNAAALKLDQSYAQLQEAESVALADYHAMQNAFRDYVRERTPFTATPMTPHGSPTKPKARAQTPSTPRTTVTSPRTKSRPETPTFSTPSRSQANPEPRTPKPNNFVPSTPGSTVRLTDFIPATPVETKEPQADIRPAWIVYFGRELQNLPDGKKKYRPAHGLFYNWSDALHLVSNYSDRVTRRFDNSADAERCYADFEKYDLFRFLEDPWVYNEQFIILRGVEPGTCRGRQVDFSIADI